MSTFLASLCLFLALLGGCRPECKAPPKDHFLVKVGTECLKKTGKDPLCLGKCVVETLEVVKDGTVNKTRIEELIETVEDGDAKEAAKEVSRKCIKDGQKIDVNKSRCMGYLPIAKCIREVAKKRCPELLKSARVK